MGRANNGTHLCNKHMFRSVLSYKASLTVMSVTFKKILTIRKKEPIIDHRSLL